MLTVANGRGHPITAKKREMETQNARNTHSTNERGGKGGGDGRDNVRILLDGEETKKQVAQTGPCNQCSAHSAVDVVEIVLGPRSNSAFLPP
jgi:hypothetical protein